LSGSTLIAVSAGSAPAGTSRVIILSLETMRPPAAPIRPCVRAPAEVPIGVGVPVVGCGLVELSGQPPSITATASVRVTETSLFIIYLANEMLEAARPSISFEVGRGGEGTESSNIDI
jgi:hypothetical protein